MMLDGKAIPASTQACDPLAIDTGPIPPRWIR
jgi:hypothetical protein